MNNQCYNIEENRPTMCRRSRATSLQPHKRLADTTSMYPRVTKHVRWWAEPDRRYSRIMSRKKLPRGFIDAIFGGISGVFNKPTINKNTHITLESTNTVNIKDIIKRLNQNITTNIIERTVKQETNNSQMSTVNLGDMMSTSGTVTLDIDISQDIYSMSQGSVSVTSVMDAVSDTISSFADELNNLQQSTQKNYMENNVANIDQANFVASLIGESTVGVDQNKNINTQLKQHSTNVTNKLRDSYIENIKKNTSITKTITTFTNNFNSRVFVNVGDITAGEDIVVKLSLSQYQNTITSLVDSLNIGLKVMGYLRQSETFTFSNKLSSDLDQVVEEVSETTTIDENTSDVIDTINPITGLTNLAGKFSSALIAGAIIIAVGGGIYMFTRSSGTTDTSTSDTSTSDTSTSNKSTSNTSISYASYGEPSHKNILYDQQAEGGLRICDTSDYGGSAGGLHYIGESFRMPT